jgi:hypothetical protein
VKPGGGLGTSRIDRAGTQRLLQAVETGATDDEVLTGAAWDAAGNAYVSFRRGTDASRTFVARMGSDGTPVWIVSLAVPVGRHGPASRAPATDAAGNVYVPTAEATAAGGLAQV